MFTLGGRVQTVEKDPLLGEAQLRRGADRLELDRGEGDRDARFASIHVIRIDDPLVFHDVLVAAVEAVDRAVGCLDRETLVAADLKGELATLVRKLLGSEPAGLGRWLGPCFEDVCRFRLVCALDREGGVQSRSLLLCIHGLLPFCGCSGCSARYSPRRSRRCSQLLRRCAIQSSAPPSAFACTWQVRTRPTFSERTSPLASSTCRCWTTAGRDMASGFASSLTEAEPTVRRSTIARRVGSES